MVYAISSDGYTVGRTNTANNNNNKRQKWDKVYTLESHFKVVRSFVYQNLMMILSWLSVLFIFVYYIN